MSRYMDIINEVNHLKRQLDSQGVLINGFLRSHEEQIRMINENLDGTRSQSDKLMLDALRRSEASLKNSLQLIGRATDALLQIQAR